MTSPEPSARGSRDLLGRPSTAIFWWGLPLVAAWAAQASPAPAWAKALVWAAALAWMAAGCTLNARRCRRLHCYISAPALFAGAVGAAACALGWASLGPGTLGDVVNAALGLALLSFLAEPVWGRYRGS